MIEENFWGSSSQQEVMKIKNKKTFALIQELMDCETGCGVDFISAKISKECPKHGHFVHASV